MKKRTVLKTLAVLVCVALVCSCCLSLAVRGAAVRRSLGDDAAYLAAFLSFSNGDYLSSPESAEPTVSKPLTADERAEETSARLDEDISSRGGAVYPVVETTLTAGNMSFENISLKNTASYTPDVSALLESSLPFEVSANHRVQVLIFHTHTCESYMTEDAGYYYEDFYPRSTDGELGVCAVGEALADALKARGIGVIHDETLYDYPSYEGSYDRSFAAASAYLEKYPEIKVCIDLHRDAMTADDNTKYKPTFTYDGKKAAQIMIMSGHGDDGGSFSFWRDNLTFAVKLQKTCEDMYPGMTRPLYFGDFTYNMNLNSGSLLIEVGTDANTVEEAVRSGSYLGNALAALLKS